MRILKVSVENAAYQGLTALKGNRAKRRAARAFFVEGVRNINAAAAYGWRFDALIYVARAKLSGWAQGVLDVQKAADRYELTPGLMEKLSGKTDASELAAVIHMRDDTDIHRLAPVDGESRGSCESPIFLLFDRPSNKGNLGSILRSCDAFGVRALYLTGHSVDIYDPEVVAASAGSFFAVPFAALSESADVIRLIGDLKRAYPGLIAAGTSARADKPIYDIDLRGPALFLIGNETDGLSWKLKQIPDVIGNIPMDKGSFASSFNVACAATALLYEAARQRRRNDKDFKMND